MSHMQHGTRQLEAPVTLPDLELARALARGSGGGGVAPTVAVHIPVRGLVRTNQPGYVIVAGSATIPVFAVTGHDGLTFVQGDRVLLLNQTLAAQNGLWVVGAVVAGNAPLTRPTDFATSNTVPSSVLVAVSEGVVGQETLWQLQSNTVQTNGTFANPPAVITIDTSALNFQPYIPTNALQGNASDPSHVVRAVAYNTLNSGTYVPFAAGTAEAVTGFSTSLDGLTLVAGNRILFANLGAPNAAANGIWEMGAVTAATATLTRPSDWFQNTTVPSGSDIFVQEGSQFAGSIWALTSSGNVVVGVGTPTITPIFGALSVNANLAVTTAPWHDVRGVVTTAITLTNFTMASADLTYVAGDRVLLVAQAAPAANGIYVVGANGSGSSGAGTALLTRSIDWLTGQILSPGAAIRVSEGTNGAGTLWAVTSAGPLTIDTTSVTIQCLLSPLAVNGNTGITTAPVHRVRGVVTTAITLTNFTMASTDLTFVQGDRVLLVAQAAPAANGIYVVGANGSGSGGAGTANLTRPIDFLTGQIVPGGVIVYSAEGTGGANSTWRLLTTGAITIDTTSQTWDMDNGNWVSANGITTVGAQTIAAGPIAVVVAAMLLKVKRTGLFRCDVDVSYSSNTTAHPVTVTLISDTSAAGALAGTSKAAVGVSGFNASGSDHEIIATSPNSLTYNGAAFSTAPINQKVESGTGTGNATLTGLLTAQGGGTMKFAFHGVIYNAIGTAKTLFTVGNTMAVGVQFNATAADVLTFAEYNGFLGELPNL